MTRRVPRRVPLGMPRRLAVRLKYVETFSIVPVAAGVPYWYHFSCNGMYDPNVSGVGHQPLHFDQLMTSFSHYTVFGSKITLAPVYDSMNTTALLATAGVYGICQLGDTAQAASYTSISQLLEADQRKSRIKQASNSGWNTVNGKSGALSIQSKWSARKTFGKISSSDEQYRGSIAANPAEQTYFSVFYNCPTAAAAGLSFMATIEYFAVLSETGYTTPS